VDNNRGMNVCGGERLLSRVVYIIGELLSGVTVCIPILNKSLFKKIIGNFERKTCHETLPEW